MKSLLCLSFLIFCGPLVAQEGIVTNFQLEKSISLRQPVDSLEQINLDADGQALTYKAYGFSKSGEVIHFLSEEIGSDLTLSVRGGFVKKQLAYEVTDLSFLGLDTNKFA